MENTSTSQFFDLGTRAVRRVRRQTQRLREHTRRPLYRNAYAWMFSTGFSSALGILYWILAARYYSVEVVGLSSAAISAMIFVSGVAQLNLSNVLVRFLPTAGPASARLVWLSYGVTTLLGLALGLVGSTIGLRFAEGFGFIQENPHFTLLFTVSTSIWCIFSLQDSVMTGVRDAFWIPIENVTFAIIKIVLLIGFAAAQPQWGIFASWMIPAILTLLPINLLIFRRLLPRHMVVSREHTQPIVRRDILLFTAGNYVASLFLLASTRLLPVLVTYRVGAEMAAYFFLAYSIASALKLITTHMSMSLTVEATRTQSSGWVTTLSSRFLRNVSLVFVPIILVLVVIAPWVLHLSGRQFSTEGTTLLRLLCLSVIPALVNLVYLSAAQVARNIRRILIIQGAFFVLIMLLSYFLIGPYGITGIGYAFLISESAIALGLLRPRLMALLRSREFGAVSSKL